MEKQAKNLEELYQIFDNQEYLEKGSPFYVDIFEKDIKKLKTAIKLNRNPKKEIFCCRTEWKWKNNFSKFSN
jgi:hypothetical protein